MRWLALVAACSSAPAIPANRAAPDPKRAQFVGTKIGVEIHDIGMPSSAGVRLPAGLTKVAVINTVDAHIVVARRRSDLVLLVTDHDGVVTDDLAIRDVADTHVVVPACAETAFLGLVAKAGCPTAQGTAPARMAWNLGTRLTSVSPAPTCPCDMLHLGE